VSGPAAQATSCSGRGWHRRCDHQRDPMCPALDAAPYDVTRRHLGLVCSLRERTTKAFNSYQFRAFRVGQFCRKDALAAQLGIGYGSLATAC
jgi:hypothetical protein